MLATALNMVELGKPLVIAGLLMMTALMARRHYHGESTNLTEFSSPEELLAIATGQFATVLGMTMAMVGGLTISLANLF